MTITTTINDTHEYSVQFFDVDPQDEAELMMLQHGFRSSSPPALASCSIEPSRIVIHSVHEEAEYDVVLEKPTTRFSLKEFLKARF